MRSSDADMKELPILALSNPLLIPYGEVKFGNAAFQFMDKVRA
jgi:hypothetical protein